MNINVQNSVQSMQNVNLCLIDCKNVNRDIKRKNKTLFASECLMCEVKNDATANEGLFFFCTFIAFPLYCR